MVREISAARGSSMSGLVRARLYGLSQIVGEPIRHFLPAEGAIRSKPAGHQVHRSHEEKDGKLWIDIADRPVFDAFCDKGTETTIKAFSAGHDRLLAFGLEGIELHQHCGCAKFSREEFDVPTRKRHHSIQPAAGQALRERHRLSTEFVRNLVAGVKDLFLVLDVVVESRLRD